MEIWKDIKGYEGKYQVSHLGRIKSCERFAKTRGDGLRKIEEFIMKIPIQQMGYSLIILTKNGKQKGHAVHRLAAIAFIPNPNKKKTVNHINGIKTDNRIENLEWCSHSENNAHFARNTNTKYTNKKKPVNCYDLNGKLLKKYPSIRETKIDGFIPMGVMHVLRGKVKKHKGHVFKYA